MFKRNFIFCHGFGFDSSFWKNLIPYFLENECYSSFKCFDSGYFRNQRINTANAHNWLYEPNDHIIGIGHSLGLLKLLRMGINFNYIIGINGFINFLGNELILQNKRQTELDSFRNNFNKYPLHTLKKFYKTCGVSSFTNILDEEEINIKTMSDDLNLLNLNVSLPNNTPVLIITADDVVVPNEIIYDNFRNYINVTIELISNTSHGLGLLNADKIYKKIMSFINDGITKKNSE